MKKITLALFCLAATLAVAQNLIVNPDFDDVDPELLDGWAHTSWDGSLGTTAIDAGSGDYYTFMKGENGLIYQKVAVQANARYNCTVVFRFIKSRQTTGYGYAIETDTPLTPPDVATIVNGSSAFKGFANNNGGVWTEFGTIDNVDVAPEDFTRTYSFDTPAGATFAYIAVGTKGAVSQLELNSVSLEFDSLLSFEDFDKPKLSVYPNPTNDVLNIQNLKGQYSYNIYDVSGKLLQTEDKKTNKQISINTLKQGLYVLELIDSENFKSISKIIKN